MKHVALSLALAALAAAGCASKDEKPAEVTQVTPPSTTRSTTTPPPSTTNTQRGTGLTENPLTDPNSPLAKRSVYFDFDSNVVKDEYQGTVQAHSRYLGDKRDLRIRIEGNTDERGSREYNLALGQRRAAAARRWLTQRGIAEERIELVAFGEERPTCTTSDESCWALNRRDAFEITVGTVAAAAQP